MNTSYYTAKSSYFNLMNERMIQEENMRTFFTACNIVMEGSNDLSPLNEGVGDNLKNGWNKLVQFVKEIVAKFTESITNLFSSEKGWLEKYKNIILTKKPAEDATIDDFPPYDIGYQRITGATVPQFNPENDASKLASNEEFIKYVCPAIGSVFKDVFPDGAESKLSDGLTKYFRGGESRNGVQMSNLNFTDMYNFCYNYEKLSDLVKKDQKAIDSSSNNANTAIQKAIESLSTEEKNKTAEQPRDPQAEKKNDNTDSGNSADSDVKNDEKDTKKQQYIQDYIKHAQNAIKPIHGKYRKGDEPSDVKDSYNKNVAAKRKELEDKAKAEGIDLNLSDLTNVVHRLEFATLYNFNEVLYNIITEAPDIKMGKSETPKASTNTNSAATKDNNTAYNANNTTASQDTADSAASGAMGRNNNDKQAALEEISNKIKVYQDVTNAIFTAKIAVITEIFKAYMSIMRAHVRSIVGKEADTTSVAPSVASDNKSSTYTQVRMDDITRARDNYNNASGEQNQKQALATYTAVIKRIYGDSAWNNAFKDPNKGKNDEAATNNYFASIFETNFKAVNNQ